MTTTRRLRHVGPDSTDAIDVYLDAELVLPALSRPERTELVARLLLTLEAGPVLARTIAAEQDRINKLAALEATR